MRTSPLKPQEGLNRSGASLPHATELVRLVLGLLLACTFALFTGAAEHRTTLAINPDGSCRFTNETIEPRAVAEQQVRMWERFQKNAEGEDEEKTVEAEPKDKPSESKPFTDEELARKIRETKQIQDEQTGDEAGDHLEALEVKTNLVRTVTTRAFASLEEMLAHVYRLWGQSGLHFENVRFEKDAESHLRVTFSPYSGGARYAKSMRQQWKLTGAKGEFRLVLPGKVLSSGLPHSEGNATWIIIDAQKSETIDAASKLYDGPTVITSELGGLKLDQPLESKTLQRVARRGGRARPDLPVTDAGPGFTTEPLAVTTTITHYFPEGEKYLKETRTLGLESTGAVVRAKLFAPKGRTIQSVSGVRVLKATDDQGRAIAADQHSDEGMETVVYSSSGSREANSTQIQLRLALPAPDAQSIDEISGEAIAVTTGKWKELTLTNLQESATNEIDLASVLPGTKLIIAKLTSKKSQLSIQAKLKGPPAIGQLDLQAKLGSSERFNTYTSERSFTGKGDQSTRTVSIQGYGLGGEDESPTGAISLVVRHPEDQRRERVPFKLKGLDLF